MRRLTAAICVCALLGAGCRSSHTATEQSATLETRGIIKKIVSDSARSSMLIEIDSPRIVIEADSHLRRVTVTARRLVRAHGTVAVSHATTDSASKSRIETAADHHVSIRPRTLGVQKLLYVLAGAAAGAVIGLSYAKIRPRL